MKRPPRRQQQIPGQLELDEQFVRRYFELAARPITIMDKPAGWHAPKPAPTRWDQLRRDAARGWKRPPDRPLEWILDQIKDADPSEVTHEYLPEEAGALQDGTVRIDQHATPLWCGDTSNPKWSN